ncbi:MAG: AAA family ATPase [Chitinispirillales bacterium]|jgi:RecA-family ATPase|nr:AAA family ATPase [Chitinispirillales bacterium]
MKCNEAEYLELFNAAFRYINLTDGRALFISEMTEKNYSSEAISRAFDNATRSDTPDTYTGTEAAADVRRVQTKRLSDVTRKERSWLWGNVLLRGELNSIQGVPGVGKSFIIAAIAAAVSSGGKLPTVSAKEEYATSAMSVVELGKVAILTDEDDPSVIAERIETLGGDLNEVIIIDEDESIPHIQSDELETLFDDFKPALLIYDTLQASLPPDININAANEARSAFGRVLRLARKHNTCVLFIQHINKKSSHEGGGHSVFYGVGSGAINGLFRTVWTLGRVLDDEGKETSGRALIVSKSNYAKGQMPAVRFSLTFAGGFQWGEVDYDISTHDLFGKRAVGRPNQCNAAKAFIEEYLSGGMKPAEEVKAVAERNGIKKDLFYKAARELGGKYERVGGTSFLRIGGC